jgi:hypothetical protein
MHLSYQAGADASARGSTAVTCLLARCGVKDGVRLLKLRHLTHALCRQLQVDARSRPEEQKCELPLWRSILGMPATCSKWSPTVRSWSPLPLNGRRQKLNRQHKHKGMTTVGSRYYHGVSAACCQVRTQLPAPL